MTRRTAWTGNRIGRTIRQSAAWLLGVLLAAALSLPAIAQEAQMPDLGRSGSCSITVRMISRTDGKAVPGGSLQIFQVAGVEMDGGGYAFRPTGGFDTARFSYDLSEGADLGDSALAANIASYAANQQLTGTAVSIGADGQAVLSGLDLGLYLVVQDQAAEGYQKITPFLITIPRRAEDGSLVYDVDADPKVGAAAPLSDVTAVCPQIVKEVEVEPYIDENGNLITTAPTDRAFNFAFQRLDDAFPMPVNSAGSLEVGGPVVSQQDNTLVLRITGPGQTAVGEITFTAAGDYYYQVSEIAEEAEHYTYDTSVYWVKYEIRETADGAGLMLQRILVRRTNAEGETLYDGTDPAAFAATFRNHYSNLGTLSGNTGDDEEVTPTKTTGGTGGSGSAGGSPSASGTGSRLPQTGQLWWPVWVMSAAGCVLLLLGGVLKASGRRARSRG